MLHCQIDAGGQAVQMGFGGGFHPEEKLKTLFCLFLALINFQSQDKDGKGGNKLQRAFLTQGLAALGPGHLALDQNLFLFPKLPQRY